jgi:hypothetical protein
MASADLLDFGFDEHLLPSKQLLLVPFQRHAKGVKRESEATS